MELFWKPRKEDRESWLQNTAVLSKKTNLLALPAGLSAGRLSCDLQQPALSAGRPAQKA